MTLRPAETYARRCLLPALIFFLASGVTPAARASWASAPRLDPPHAAAESSSPQEPQPTPTPRDFGLLQPGQAVRRTINAGETHRFRLTLAQGQSVRAVVQQEEIDLTVSFFEPGSQQASIQMDSPNGLRGPESVSLLASASGEYALEIRAPATGPAAGRYELSSDGPRAAEAAEAKRAAAEVFLVEGRRLQKAGAGKEQFTQSVEKFTAALRLWQELGDRRQVAYAYYGLAQAYRNLGDLPKTREHYGLALAALEAEGDLYGQAIVHNDLGAALRDLDTPRNALPSYRRAYELYDRVNSPWGKAQLHNNIGIAHARLGEFAEAMGYLRQALPLWQAVGDRSMEANTHSNIGGMLERLGDTPQALASYEEALRLLQAARNPGLTATVRNNLGVLRHGFGEMQEAHENYRLALSQHRALDNPRGEATVLDNLGMLYADWGDPQRALEHFTQALAIRRRRAERRELATTLDNVGYAHYLLGGYDEARRHFEDARKIFGEVEDKQGLAYTLTHIGMVRTAEGEAQSALASYEQALRIQKDRGSRLWQAVTLDKIGDAYSLSGDLPQAAAAYGEALGLWRDLRDDQGMAKSLYGLAGVESARGNLEEARGRIEEAIRLAESRRTRTANHQLRTMYFETKHKFYELDIDIKMRLHERLPAAGFAEAALESSERARSRGLIDLLTEGHVELRAGDPRLSAHKSGLEKQLSAVSDRLLVLRSLRSEGRGAAASSEEIRKLEGNFDVLTKEYEEVLASIRASSPRYAGLTRPEPLKAAQIRGLLDEDTLLLEYALGKERSYLWAVTRAEVRGFRLAGRAEIEQAAANLRRLLVAYEPPRKGESNLKYVERVRESARLQGQRAAELSQIVLRPAAARLRFKRLAVVADGALHFIPFETLPPPAAARDARPPALTSEVVYLPSASTLALLRTLPRRNGGKNVAVFADPVFDSRDERVLAAAGKGSPGAERAPTPDDLDSSVRDMDAPNGARGLARLRYSLDEARGIMSVADGSGTEAVGFEANREAATGPSVSDHRVVHFATHALVNDKRPQLSGLVLSLVDRAGQPREGFLKLGDIYNLDLPVDLVVLSACQTGIGKEVRGEGLIGLTRGFMYAGARRVVASLWEVDDQATAELMKRFYKHLFKEDRPPAEALRLAKSEMQAERQWRAPYFWAGFVLQGDWR